MSTYPALALLLVACGGPADLRDPAPGTEDTGTAVPDPPDADPDPPDGTDSDAAADTDGGTATTPAIPAWRVTGRHAPEDLAVTELLGNPGDSDTGADVEWGDALGVDLAGPGDLDGDGDAELAVLAGTSVDVGSEGVGVIHVLTGPPAPGTSLVDSTASVTGGDDDPLGELRTAGDVDGDGAGDLVAWYARLYQHDFLVWSGAAILAGDPLPALRVGNGGQYASAVVAADVDGDDRSELLLQVLDDGPGVLRGEVAMVPGGTTGWYDATQAEVTLSGSVDGEYLGTNLGAGDVDGDGIEDVLASSGYDGKGTGAIVVFSGASLVAPVTRDDALLVLPGDAPGAMLVNASSPGDLDGDGYADLAAWSGYVAPATDRVYIQYGPITGAEKIATSDAVIWDPAGVVFGSESDPAGDVDADGFDDLAVHVPGGVAVVYGPIAGSHAIDDAVDAVFTGALRVSGVGDVDGNGSSDLLFGDPYDQEGGFGAGAVWLVLGGP